MAIYIEYEGIDGNVTAEGFAKHIDVLSMNFASSRAIGMEPGKMANREASRPNLSEISFVKVVDNSATALFKESVTGAAGKKVVIKFIRTGSDKLEQFMDYTLEDVLVSSYALSANSSGEPVESISLSYAKITINYSDFDKTNTQSSPQRVGYDLTAGKPL